MAAPSRGRSRPRHRVAEHTDELAASQSGTTSAAVGASAAVPAAPVELPLTGVRIVDLTAFWAGPIIGHACATLGAEVVHVESSKRPDGIRSNAVRPMTEPQWWEWSPFYQGSNVNKLDLAVDLDTRAAARSCATSSATATS